MTSEQQNSKALIRERSKKRRSLYKSVDKAMQFVSGFADYWLL